MTRIDARIEVTALGFRNKKDQNQLESFPKRMVWGDREYNFADMTMQYLVKKGQQLIKLFDVTDGNTSYRLRLEDDRWTLVGTSGSNLVITQAKAQNESKGTITMHQEDLSTLASSGNVAVHGGFPNPALDRMGQGNKLALDLNQALIKHPSSTYLFRINGHSNEAEGIFDGDLAIIDRSLQPRVSDLVLAWQASGFMLCRYSQLNHQDTFWGVVSTTIHERRAQL